ncbi:phosphoglycerate dehydrogenase [Luteitalea sp.]|uniref:phosphoglycerate dehydrogenase n=1 Tax=Luteitalea sp. TaxID=2004800 RepID=UPI0025C600FB|nr:phosphoglycerate dehydrogenase [Luteitalea sp.]
MAATSTVLVTAPRACQSIDSYRAAFEPRGWRLVLHPPVERHDEEALLPLVTDADALICGDDQVTDRVLAVAPRLKIIAKWGTGIDSIDLDAARRRGVVVANTPDAFSAPVADSVLAYLLLFARRPDAMTADVRAGRWHRLPLVALNELTLGIVGFGNIGRAVACRAAAFGMSLLAHDRCSIEDEAARYGARVTTLEELLASSDCVTLHANSRPDNRHLINKAALALMKPTAILVNTARGALVDEQALISALVTGRLAGAALDVFDDEPLSPGSPLTTLPNVYLAPHNSNSSPAAAARVHANTIGHVVRVLDTSTS